jgi:hypothetical protein
MTDDHQLPTYAQSGWPDIRREPEVGPEFGVLSTPIRTLAAELAGEGAFTAPVQLPSKGQMTVRLVPVAVLERLDEARSDTMLVMSAFLTLAGAELGLLPAVTSAMLHPPKSDPITVSLFCAGLLFLGFTGFLWWRGSRRVAAVRNAIFGTQPT